MREDELKDVGRQWLRVVELVRREGIGDEHNHVRFRDSDLSVKGAALLGFAGLTLAADLVFLSGRSSKLHRARPLMRRGGFCSAFFASRRSVVRGRVDPNFPHRVLRERLEFFRADEDLSRPPPAVAQGERGADVSRHADVSYGDGRLDRVWPLRDFLGPLIWRFDIRTFREIARLLWVRSRR